MRISDWSSDLCSSDLFQFQAKYLGHCFGAATPEQRHLNLSFHPTSARHNLVEGEERCIIADAHKNNRMISDNPRIERLAQSFFIVPEERRQIAHIFDRMAPAETCKIVKVIAQIDRKSVA